MKHISDEELFDFYQLPLSYLACAEGDMPYAIMNEDDICDEAWHRAAFSALVRLTMSGLAEFGPNSDLKKILTELSLAPITNTESESPYFSGITWLRDWVSVIVEPTSKGEVFAKNCGLTPNPGVLVPGFREALSRIFDEHGVGFDAELPYKMQF